MSAIFPSQSTWITPRSEQGQITTENSLIILPQKIEKIDKVILHLPSLRVNFDYGGKNVTAKLKNLFVDEQHTISLGNIDISRYVVEEAKYKTLTTYKAGVNPFYYESLYTNNTWYYNTSGTNIMLVNDLIRGNIQIGGNTVLKLIIASALYSYIYNNGKKDGKLFYYDSASNSSDVLTYGELLIISVLDAIDIQKVPFRIYYTPLGESVKLQVPKTNPKANQFCIPYSQQQPIVDNVTLGREMQSVANRAGCEKKEVVRTIHSINDKRKLGTIYREKDDDGNFKGNIWRLTGERTSIYSDT